jgi:hypothetical protein
MNITTFSNELIYVHSAIINYRGDKEWYINGKLNRDNDLPAFERANGSKSWYVNGLRHRDNDLPAIVDVSAYGYKSWYVDGKQHRDNDLPALENVNGHKEWYTNGKRYRINDLHVVENLDGKYWFLNNMFHRLGGLPAIEYANGNKHWYLYGKEYTYEQVYKHCKILTRFGRHCLKKIRIKRLKRVKMIHRELLCMPPKGSYPGGQDYHKMVNYFMSMNKN